MIKKSLYLRIVGTFIGVVTISLVASYFVTSMFFHQEVIFEEEVNKVTTGVAQLVSLTEHDKIPTMIETLNQFNFEVLFVHQNGSRYSNKEPSFSVSEEMLEEIISGSEQVPILLPYSSKKATRLVGMPIEIDNEKYGLFINFNYEEEVRALKRVTLFALFLVLFMGSLFILLASRHLVHPIKRVTHAAKQMATGNFSVRLKSKNKDEIGELITSFNYMAAELEKIDRMREDFVSNVSHEIHSPLTSIKGFTKALRDEVIPKEHQKEYLDIIYQESDRLSRLGESLLQLASLDSEHHPYHPVKYRLDEQLRRTVLATEPQWKIKNLHIQLDLASIEVVADQDLFEQVWLNLLTNAIKYSDEEGTIGISLERQNDEIIVRVQDSGKGIPEVAIPHLFERFYKVDQARSSSIKGNGLGLSIVKKILSIHGCTIDVESEEGAGSTFSVRIPFQPIQEK
ncbi:sensor histidine kinase [Caldalkalibacillus mannanilyticus]|uniref:sensor histidine kinase n=1 Tax=Caldalkalibacillus mannanilyticus TaxID=1418 RepID=UPI00068560C6|nr:HAMP domain-containing sensor histidine kinase [Caldalkalibacillus mannanilyticus]